MAKDRVAVLAEVAAKVLFAADHTCCVCREPGRPVQIHHVDGNPTNNNESNLSVLCLLHHDDTQVTGGFGRKLDAKLVIAYRDDWNRRVATRRDRADELAALKMADVHEAIPTTEAEASALMVPADEALVAYIWSLPGVLTKGYELARPLWSGSTVEMVQGTYDLIDVVVQMLVHLGSWFPENHFGENPAPEYFSQFVSSRFVWRRALAEPDGPGTGGTIVGPITASGVLEDVERAVTDVVKSLLWEREGFDLKEWRKQWERQR